MDSTQIQLATGLIDVEVNFPVTISFNDVTKRGSRTGGYSNTIEVKGSQNNRRLLGMYFDVDLETTTFNRKAKTECSIIQNGVEVFEGFIKLLSVKRTNQHSISNEKDIIYTVFVFDEIANLFNEMGNKELTDLDFTDLNHTFNRTNIIASWSNTEGYIYPQFPTTTLTYTVRDFKPAIFEFEYFKRIFATNGYQFNFPEANTSKFKMDKRIVPYNGKTSNDVVSKSLINAFKVVGEDALWNWTNVQQMPLGFIPSYDFIDTASLVDYLGGQQQIELAIIQDAEQQYDIMTGFIQNQAGDGRTATMGVNFKCELTMRAFDVYGTPTADWGVSFYPIISSRAEIHVNIVIQSLTNNENIAVLANNTPVKVYETDEPYNTHAVTFPEVTIQASGQLGLLAQNENIRIVPLVFMRYFAPNGDLIETPSLNEPFLPNALHYGLGVELYDSITFYRARVNFDIEISELLFTYTPDISELVPDAPVDMKTFIPQKIKQRDLIASIAKTYNLFFIQDEQNPKLINIISRNKFIDDAPVLDWSQKIDEINQSEITFLDNEVEKTQIYTYKEDKDIMNTSYQQELQRVYGDAQIVLDNEYTKGEQKNELIYSPTPSINAAIGVTLPSINGINPDCNVRVLLNNGIKPCLPYQFYNDLLANTTDFITVNECLHTSMFDNDQQPNFSICFDAPLYLFHPTQTSQTDNYLYNIHHQREVSILNSGSMLTAYFDLTELDFQQLSKSLQYKVYIKDNGWFYINKIDQYNASVRTLTKVELISLDDVKLKFLQPSTPISSGSQSQNGVVQQHNAAVDLATNIWTIQEIPLIIGTYNFVSGSGNIIMGSRNVVQSSGNVVMGNRNTLLAGSDGSRILGDASRITARANIVGGRNINQDVITLAMETGSLHKEFVAAYDFVISSVTFLTAATTATIEVNTLPYVFGEQIAIGDVVRVDIAAHTTLNLNILR